MNKKKKWIITAIVLVVFCLILGLYNLLNDKAPASDDAAKAPIAPRRQSTLNVNGRIVRPQRLTDGITTVGNLLPGRGGGPLVRNLGQNRGDQLPGGHRRPQGRAAGQGQRPAARGPALALRGAAQTGRRPRLPPERLLKRTP